MRTLLGAALSAALLLGAAGCTRELQAEDNSDPAIRARIEFVLNGRRDLDLSHITIDVYSRVVTISGIAASAGQSRAIVRLVNGVRGVDDTIDNIVVQE